MKDSWIALSGIPPEGRRLTLEDQAVWLEPIAEFSLPCRIVEPLKAEVQVLAQEQGVLFRGLITGVVSLPCDRCAEDSMVTLKHRFDSFEPFPPLPPEQGTKARGGKAAPEPADEEGDPEVDEAVIRLAAHGRDFEINPAALVWEEFSLALPVKPLCSEDCKGLCPVCGSDKNSKTCVCAAQEGDPRLAGLRGLTISKK